MTGSLGKSIVPLLSAAPRLFSLLAALLFTLLPGRAAGQTWEYSPYEIVVWIALEPSAQLSPRFEQEISSALISGARGVAGYAWHLTPDSAPQSLNQDLVLGRDDLSLALLQSAHPEVLQGDKLVVVTVREADLGFDLSLRELDVATRLWSDAVHVNVPQRDAVPSVAADAFIHVIRPLAKIEKVTGKTIVARLRAGGLVTTAQSPAQLEPGSVLQPVVRRNKRNGEPLENGIYAPPWSYLAVDARADTVITCSLQSGYGSVIPSKGGPRTIRLALGVAPRFAGTRLELRARETTPARTGRPLAGYEVYGKYPGEESTELMGLTDWQGGIELPRTERPLRLFYIKNGGQLLARLPLLVGHRETAVATVLDDDPRLQAEVYIKSMQSRVLDTVARREILAVRIRSKLKKGDFAAAKSLVQQFRELPNRVPLMRELEDAHRRFGNSTGVTARRIDKLFQDGRKLLQAFLDPETADVLAREVAESERKGPPTDSKPATSPTPPVANKST